MELTEQQLIDRDLDLWEIEREWKQGQKRRTDVEWLVIFPQAKSKFGKMILSTLKFNLKMLDWDLAWIKFKTKKDLLANPVDTKWRDELIKDFYYREIRRIEKEVRFNKEQIALYRRIGNTKLQVKEGRVIITGEMVKKAREYPLEKLVEINRQKFTRCFAHNDKKPSAYCKNNFVHCFVCSKSWDTIAILVERDGMSFREAVLKLQ